MHCNRSSEVSRLHFIQSDKDGPAEAADGNQINIIFGNHAGASVITVKISPEPVKGMSANVDSQHMRSTHYTATLKC